MLKYPVQSIQLVDVKMNMVSPPALNKKKILIVGGGVAGMEAARVAAIRGHAVTLYEKNEKLGGNLIPGGTPDFKEDDHALIRWYKRQLELLRVTIELNRTVTLEELKASNADEILLSTGSVPKILKVDGVNMITAEDVLNKKLDIGKSRIIVGGGLCRLRNSPLVKRKQRRGCNNCRIGS